MKAFLIFLLILVVLFLLIYPFLGAMIKDRRELSGTSLQKKYPFFFETISYGLFAGKGEVYEFPDNPKAVNMMSTDPNCQNMIVHFLYSTGNMIMELGFKYYQQELTFQETAYGLRDGSIFTQKDLANAFVEKARLKIYEHKLKVTELLSPGKIVNHISVDKPFDEMDGLEMIENSFGAHSVPQKEALMCIAYIVATSNGDPDEVFLCSPAIRQQLRFFNISWDDCKMRLMNDGESGLFDLLFGIDVDTIAMAETFLSAATLSLVDGAEDPVKKNKLYYCLDKIGISKEEFNEIALKNKLISEFFIDKK